MKKRKSIIFHSLCILLLTLFSLQTSHAQIDLGCPNDGGFTNGSFEDLIWGCPPDLNGCIVDAFNFYCVDNWYAANGSPDVCETVTDAQIPVNAFHGDYMARILAGWVNGVCYNEAFFTPLSLDQNKSYNLSFYHRNGTSNPTDPNPDVIMEVYLTSGLTIVAPGGSPCSDLDLPGNSVLVFSDDNFNANFWSYENVCFNPEPGLDQLVFLIKSTTVNSWHEMWMVDAVCLEEFDPCQAIADLDACAAEEDYGFIHLQCTGKKLTYDWEFPSGSTAFQACPSTIVQASEGIYSVTITNSIGCTSVEEFEIIADCCETTTNCEPPTNPRCEQGSPGEIILVWDPPAQGAPMGYEIEIIPWDPDCCLLGPSIDEFTIGPIYATTYAYDYPADQTCFSWKVRKICDDNLYSEYAQKLCFTPSYCFYPNTLQESGSERSLKLQNLNPRVFPNPSSDELNFQLNASGELSVTLEIYSADGKLVKSFGEEKNSDGIFRKNWSLNNQLADGLYYAIFNTNYGRFQEKLVVAADK